MDSTSRPRFHVRWAPLILHSRLLRLIRQAYRKTHPENPTYFLSRSLFLRALGLIYGIAILSLWTQILGLVGHDGILPIGEYLEAVKKSIGSQAYWRLPTLLWINVSDATIHVLCASGLALSLALVLGLMPLVATAGLWLVYLSLAVAGRDFTHFQWDTLLLETGLLAVFLSPARWRLDTSAESPPSKVILFLFYWLLFRLMFMSGFVKLTSADPTWWGLSALDIHYQTQPLPTWIGWVFHQAPTSFHRASVFVMFVIELVLPAFIFAWRPSRKIAFGAFVFLMTLITLTGNYGFFNLLTIAICLLLLDDAFWRRFYPRWAALPNRDATPLERKSWAMTLGAGAIACLIVLVSAVQMAPRFLPARWIPSPMVQVHQWLSPFRSINSYGLFARMTTTRPEIIIEGSQDGVEWKAYEFKWKPGVLEQRPRFVAPHMPRIDWQMWFAALGHYQNSWFIPFLTRLLEHNPQVLALLKTNPFPDQAPRYIRATLFEYRFSDASTRKQTGQWWTRKRLGPYCPTLTLRQPPPQ